MSSDRLVLRLVEQNPWWENRGAVETDFHLTALDKSPFVWKPSLLEQVDLSASSVTTIRGPRQVGKTTLLKLLVRRLIEDGHPPERILYYSLDLERDPEDLVEIVRTAKTLSSTHGRWFVFFDEISAVVNWQRGIKYLRDQTDAADDCFVLTGSSAADVRAGAERLPGRRGPGRRLDKIMLPMSFREFLDVTATVKLSPQTVPLTEFLTPPALGPWLKIARDLDAALGRYAVTGGFPRAVRDSFSSPAPGAETFDQLWAMVAGDIDRAGRDRISALKILERTVRSLSSPISWLSVAQDAGLGSPHTAQSYATLLADSFVLLIMHTMDLSRGPSLRKSKKLYFCDPAFGFLPRALDPGAPLPATPAMIENLVAIALYRAVEREPAESLASPQRVGFWRSSSGREVDFVCRIGRHNVPIEVKYGSKVSGKDREAMRRSFRRGIFLSRDAFGLEGDTPTIPAAIFLAIVDERA